MSAFIFLCYVLFTCSHTRFNPGEGKKKKYKKKLLSISGSKSHPQHVVRFSSLLRNGNVDICLPVFFFLKSKKLQKKKKKK